MILPQCTFQTPMGICFRARFERKAATVVSSSSAILASGTLSPMILPSNGLAASVVLLLSEIAANTEGGLSGVEEGWEELRDVMLHLRGGQFQK